MPPISPQMLPSRRQSHGNLWISKVGSRVNAPIIDKLTQCHPAEAQPNYDRYHLNHPPASWKRYSYCTPRVPYCYQEKGEQDNIHPKVLTHVFDILPDLLTCPGQGLPHLPVIAPRSLPGHPTLGRAWSSSQRLSFISLMPFGHRTYICSCRQSTTRV